MFEIDKELDEFFSSSVSVLNKELKENRLERMEALLSYLDHPEKSFIPIHVAGSKGKGSVSYYLSLMLEKNGYKTALYLSPHVYSVRERFTLSGLFFSDSSYHETLLELKEKLKTFSFTEYLGPNKPTTFELYTAYAYLLFKNEKVDYAVIETGLGGRLDATNTLESKMSIITLIEKEHTNILGNTLSLIAKEKSGIMRSNTPTIVLDQSEEVIDVLEEKEKLINSPLFICPVNKDEKQVIVKDGVEYRVELPLEKDSERINGYLAFYSLIKLITPKVKDYRLDTNLPARYEKKEFKEKELVFDGAHTPLSISDTLSSFLKEYGEGRSLIFSTAIDKKEEEMEELLFPHFKEIILTTLGEWKKCDEERLKGAVSRWKEKDIQFYPHPFQALNALKGNVALVTGSFYLCSEINKTFEVTNGEY